MSYKGVKTNSNRQKFQFRKLHWNIEIIRIITNHLQMYQIFALNSSYGVDIPLNNQTKVN